MMKKISTILTFFFAFTPCQPLLGDKDCRPSRIPSHPIG